MAGRPSVDRRAFLGGAAGVAASLLATRRLPARDAEDAAAAPPPRKVRKIRKALKLSMVRLDGTWEERFRVLREVGFDGVEPGAPSDLDLAELVAASEATGLALPGVVGSRHWQQPLNHPDEAVRTAGRLAIEQGLRDAKTLGASTLLVVPAVVNRDWRYEDAYRLSQAELRKVVPLAEELGVKIAIENVWNGFLLSPLEAARYVDAFESDAIGWYLDVGNLVRYAWPEHWVRTLGHRVLKLDVKDYSRKKQNEEGLWKGFEAEIGDGDSDWPRVMAALDEIGFEGWASAEVGGGGRERLKEIADRMDRVLRA